MLKYFMFLALVVFGLNCSKPKSNEPSQSTAPSMENVASADVIYRTPDGWISEPPSNSMRKAQYRIPGAKGSEDAELGVFFFPGSGGSVDANLDRWYGQFKQPDGSQTKDKVTSKKSVINSLAVTVVYVSGTYMKPRGGMMGGPVDEMKNYAMRSAIVETSNGPWFFKVVGPQITVDKCTDQFNALVQSFEIRK
jgi:hypothetical protein